MLKSLRKRSIRAGVIFFVAGGALAVALKKMFKDQYIEDAASGQQQQQQQQRQQQQQQKSGHAADTWQSRAPASGNAAQEEQEYREFQEFKRFKEQKRLREQSQQAEKAP